MHCAPVTPFSIRWVNRKIFENFLKLNNTSAGIFIQYDCVLGSGSSDTLDTHFAISVRSFRNNIVEYLHWYSIFNIPFSVSHIREDF